MEIKPNGSETSDIVGFKGSLIGSGPYKRTAVSINLLACICMFLQLLASLHLLVMLGSC